MLVRERGVNPEIVMGMTMFREAPSGSISEHFHGSGPGCLEELIWSAQGAHLGLSGSSSGSPGSSFGAPRELKTGFQTTTNIRSNFNCLTRPLLEA